MQMRGVFKAAIPMKEVMFPRESVLGFPLIHKLLFPRYCTVYVCVCVCVCMLLI